MNTNNLNKVGLASELLSNPMDVTSLNEQNNHVEGKLTYVFTHRNGDKFTCVGKTLDESRNLCNAWLKEKGYSQC